MAVLVRRGPEPAMNALLAVTRAVHLGSVLLLFGELVFAVCVAAPAGRGAGERAVQVRNGIERRVGRPRHGGLAVSIVSGSRGSRSRRRS